MANICPLCHQMIASDTGMGHVCCKVDNTPPVESFDDIIPKEMARLRELTHLKEQLAAVAAERDEALQRVSDITANTPWRAAHQSMVEVAEKLREERDELKAALSIANEIANETDIGEAERDLLEQQAEERGARSAFEFAMDAIIRSDIAPNVEAYMTEWRRREGRK